MMVLLFIIAIFALLSCNAEAFASNTILTTNTILTSARNKQQLRMADSEITWPNKKKCKVAVGSSMKDAAKKAGFTPNYGCEEGKCGSCELKVNGKTKIRPCIGKVPSGPVTLTEP